jgi:hypothetical protein
MMKSPDEVLQHLARSRLPCRGLPKASLPTTPGVYGFFLHGPRLAQFEISPKDGLVYVGKSEESLQGRELGDHLADGSTGWSTLRRSIGAILKDAGELHLEAVPRGRGNSKNDFTNYCFSSDGETRLTHWMIENLDIAVYSFCGTVGQLRQLETQVILKGEPLLNLKEWKNPMRSAIKRMRKTCADEAKAEVGKAW